MNRTAKSILLWSNGYDLPSFRHRIRSMIPALEADGWKWDILILPSKTYYRRIIRHRRLIQKADVVLMSKLKPVPLESMLIRKWARRVVYDIDDAIYYKRPRTVGDPPGKSWWRMKKFGTACRVSDLVIAGNTVLAGKAAAFTDKIEILPTPLDTSRYPEVPSGTRSPHTLVWIGLPNNLNYLELIRPVLGRLSQEVTDLRLKIISSRFPDWPEIPVVPCPWHPDTEAEHLATSGIGIMPLSDDDWARGKCAFKLLQYMAAGLACVASPVGVNADVVSHGTTGFLAQTQREWYRHLKTLIDHPEKQQCFGQAGREKIQTEFDTQVVGARLIALLNQTLA